MRQAARSAQAENAPGSWNEQLKCVFHPVGNLKYRTNNALVENFQVNSEDELTQNTNGGSLTVMGTTTSKATNVTVNGTNSASLYKDSTFAAANMPLTTAYTAVAQDSYGRGATNTATVSLSTNITYQYDGNGNLTIDGLRSFAYDNENQLIQVWVPGQWFSQFTYDGKMRRRIRQEFTWQGSAWVQTNAVYYVYDGNLVIQERGLDYVPTMTYTRGKDLSGSLQGAGGIGELLARTDNTALQTAFYHADGNGNITMLINSSQAIVAKYLYDAFGNTLSKSGSLADANVYRFSSKEAHANSGLIYYLYRYYDPNLQRWPNRDPKQEKGGLNLYEVAANDPINRVDFLGLENVQIVATTLIRPPDAQSGVKSIQQFVVNNTGSIVGSPSFWVGQTVLPGINWPLIGSGSFWQNTRRIDQCRVLAWMNTTTTSAVLPNSLDIDYDFGVLLNFCSRCGWLRGTHDSYPSYVVTINGTKILDFQQQESSFGTLGDILELYGNGRIKTSVSFHF
jgi:RHS repeat-associated protein